MFLKKRQRDVRHTDNQTDRRKHTKLTEAWIDRTQTSERVDPKLVVFAG